MENERKEQPSRFVKVHEVMEICDCSERHASRIMKQLNAELKKRGFITTAGRVQRSYLMERMHV